MGDIEREVIRADGLDPDDRAVVTAINLIRRELSMYCCVLAAYWQARIDRDRCARNQIVLVRVRIVDRAAPALFGAA